MILLGTDIKYLDKNYRDIFFHGSEVAINRTQADI